MGRDANYRQVYNLKPHSKVLLTQVATLALPVIPLRVASSVAGLHGRLVAASWVLQHRKLGAQVLQSYVDIQYGTRPIEDQPAYTTSLVDGDHQYEAKTARMMVFLSLPKLLSLSHAPTYSELT
jgi:hypothetical protein